MKYNNPVLSIGTITTTMENTPNGNRAQDSVSSQNDWQQAENDTNQWLNDDASENTDVDLKSAEANGYGTDEDSVYASSDNPERDTDSDDDDDDDDTDLDTDDDEDDDDDDDEAKSDWGSVDPLQNLGGMSSGMDPSGPGSAV